MPKTGQAAIPNGEQIIERFGGIRPMAHKMGVAVTTIQGWKKRNAIPETRKAALIEAARAHNVEITDLLSPVPQAAGGDAQSEAPKAAFVPHTSSVNPVRPAPERVQEQNLAMIEKNAVKKSTVINLVVVTLVALAMGALFIFGPTAGDRPEPARLENLEQTLSKVENDVEAVKAQQSFLKTLVPEDLDERIARLQDTAEKAHNQIDAALQKAEQISDDVLGEEAGTLEERLDKLETHVEELGTGPLIEDWLGRIQGLRETLIGQEQIDETISVLHEALNGAENALGIESALTAARSQSEAVSQTFEGVPSQDLKAAVMLLGMTQFRESLNRDAAPFEQDLGLLMKLAGEEDAQLQEALVRLAPYAQSGVLTPTGLSTEFKSLAGEAIIASLQGEKVSLQERAQARFGEMFELEKDGELISGTETQVTVAKAEKLLADGDIVSAIAAVETLQGPAADVIAPWLTQARATALAGDVKGLLNQTIKTSMSGAAGNITARGGQGNSTLIRDEAAGISVLRRDR